MVADSSSKSVKESPKSAKEPSKPLRKEELPLKTLKERTSTSDTTTTSTNTTSDGISPTKTSKTETSSAKSAKESISPVKTAKDGTSPAKETVSSVKTARDEVSPVKVSKETISKSAKDPTSKAPKELISPVKAQTKCLTSPAKSKSSSLSDTQQISEKEIITIADRLIPKLLVVCTPGKQLTKCVEKDEITQLCSEAKKVFLSQPPLIEVKAPMRICGDIHGQYMDLLRLFDKGGFPPSCNYLFLGDYVDRGRQNLETICLLLCYKVKYPNNFFLLRGNHECSMINRVYGFYDECNRRYQSFRLWQTFQDVFNVMPFCALIGESILCMHGGLSPRLKSLDQLRQIQRPVDPPNPSMLIDLLWSDPNPRGGGWQPSPRGLSYTFGADVVTEMCQKLDIDMIVRAHQVVQDGYELFANRKLVTLFSAPHYCGQFNNAAAMMYINEELTCSFEILRPRFVTPAVPTSPLSSKTSSASNSLEDIRN